MKQYIAGNLVASILAVLTTVCAPGAYAADVATWTDASGDHLWHNAANWNPNTAVPNHNNEIHIPSGTWTINVGSGFWYGPLIIDEGSGSVTFIGSGTLQRSNSANLSIGAGRELIVDGCTFHVGSSLKWDGATLRVRSGEVRLDENVTSTLGGTCRVCVEGGVFGGTGVKDLSITNSASLIISGGLVHLRSYKVYGSDVPGESGGLIRLTGGTLHNDDNWACYRTQIYGGRFENLGGTVIWGSSGVGDSQGYNRLSSETGHDYGEGETFASYLPQIGAILDIPSTMARDEMGALRFAVPGDYSFGGTVFVTNATADAKSACVYFGNGLGQNDETFNISGGAAIFANVIRTSVNRKANLDFSRVNLGQGGINLASASKMRFVNDVVFGAWGDWSVAFGNSNTFLLMAGAATFDTLDCFDGTTTHTIGMTADIAEATELKAVGGGTVTLAAQTEKNELRLIEVGAGTTFNLTGKMKTMNLTLGDGAILGLDISSGGYLDAAATASFGEGAKIAVTALPATLAEGMFYPVYSAPAGTDPDLSKIEYAEGDWPTGWHLAKRGGAVYLTDGKEPVYSDSSNWFCWSGGGSDNIYENADNWGGTGLNGNMYNTYGGGDIYFNGRKNTDVYITTSLVQRRWLFGEDAGPFLLGGNLVRFQYPNSFDSSWSPSIQNNSRFPVVVSNTLATAKEGFALWMAARQQGSISLMGLGCMDIALENHVPLFVGGDIRIGGAYTSEYVRAASDNYWDSSVTRPTRLTIMPGGSLNSLSQSGDFNERGAGALAVATGGVLDIAGTELLLSSNNTHYVDGALTVSCPLVPQGRQTFRGDGTLTLAGGVSSAAGGVRVEGNLTLVPSDWKNDVELSVKDNVTIAPTGDWTFGGDASIDLDDHSTLTLATGGHKLRLAKPLVSRGTLSVAGNGTVEIATEGMSLDKVRMADGATFSVAKNILSLGTQVDVLTVRDDDDSITFSADVPKLKKRVDERGYTIYSVKGGKGLSIFVR